MRAPSVSPPSSLSPHRLARLALLALLLAQAQVHAQIVPNSWPADADASRAEAPTAPLDHPALAPQPPLPEADASPHAWRLAHEAVAEFPRGHADIVAWEARQPAAPSNVRAPVAVPKMAPGHHQHGPVRKAGSGSDEPAPHPPTHRHHHAPGSQP